MYTLSDTFRTRVPTAFKCRIQTYHFRRRRLTRQRTTALVLSLLFALHARTVSLSSHGVLNEIPRYFSSPSSASLTDAVITGTADKLLLFENVRVLLIIKKKKLGKIFQFSSLLFSIVLQYFPFYPTEIFMSKIQMRF